MNWETQPFIGHTWTPVITWMCSGTLCTYPYHFTSPTLQC